MLAVMTSLTFAVAVLIRIKGALDRRGEEVGRWVACVHSVCVPVYELTSIGRSSEVCVCY